MKHLLLSLTLALVACNEGSKERACEPTTGEGCEPDEKCAVDAEGTPVCLNHTRLRLEGDVCESSEDCAPGQGCLSAFGTSRCLRFCAQSLEDACAIPFLASTDGDLDDDGVGDPDDLCPWVPDPEQPDLDGDGLGDACHHAFSAAAQCLAVLPDRPDIGACLLPCSPTAGGCPDGLTCQVVPSAPFPVCTPAGTLVALYQDCGGDRTCPSDQLCASQGPARRCLPLKGEADCPNRAEPSPIPNTWDVVGDGELMVCRACTPLTPPRADGSWLELCLGDVDALTDPCLPYGGELIGREVESQLQALLSTTAALGEDRPLWVGATRVSGDFIFVDDGLPASVAAGAGDCATLVADGLIATPCETLAPALCRQAP